MKIIVATPEKRSYDLCETKSYECSKTYEDNRNKTMQSEGFNSIKICQLAKIRLDCLSKLKHQVSGCETPHLELMKENHLKTCKASKLYKKKIIN